MATATYRCVTSFIAGSVHFNASTNTPNAPASSNVALLFSDCHVISCQILGAYHAVPFRVNSCNEGSAFDLISMG